MTVPPQQKELPILVVDDDEATLLLLRQTLELAGYTRVSTTADPAAALRLFAAVRPRLVLLDLHMPGTDGLEVMARLEAASALDRTPPFLVMTADVTEEAKLRALATGARDFLAKPLDRAELLLRVRNLLRVQQLQDRLIEQNGDLERERMGLLRDVAAMQAALVPDVLPRVGDLDVSVAYRPAEGPAAGGDFYDLFSPAPGTVAVIVGDVCGHGREALVHATLTRFTLRAYLQAGLEPRVALQTAGRALADHKGERYATVAVGAYEERSHTLTYALAGHPPPILTELGCPMFEPLTVCSSPPLGWGLPTGCRQTTVSLAAGARACFFSDGLIEARRDGEVFGREHLRELLGRLGPHPHAEDLLDRVRASAQRVPDDMVACLLSTTSPGRAPRVHVEELEVDAEALRRGCIRHFLSACAIAPQQVRRVLRRAAELVGTSGSALLRVHLAPQVDVAVSAPASTPAQS